MAVRSIKRILLFDNRPVQAERLVSELGLDPGLEIMINPDISLLKDADVICTATPSKAPLFGKSQIKPGVHINAVGSYRPDMQEIDPEVMGAAKIYLDQANACLDDSGDLLVPMAMGIIRREDVVGEIGELAGGVIPGRKEPGEITLFKSVGSAIQDFFIANEAYELSKDFNDSNWINFTE
jgi:ornithine cyclodeaminase/alanine dehydrogenase-like protein (mu-crystallin family)